MRDNVGRAASTVPGTTVPRLTRVKAVSSCQDA